MLSARSKKVLVAPLDWGLGHATRCIPVIHELLAQGCEVQVASSGDALKLLREEFPELKVHELSSYDPTYSSTLPFVVKIVLQLPKFIRTINKEHRQVANIFLKEKMEIIISDNRFGCWNRNTKNIFITHQVNILLNHPWKWLSPIVNYCNRQQIKKFDECWVPDFQNGFSGRLSQVKNSSVRFIGMLSRLEAIESNIKYRIAAIISGPEPQRSIFEMLLRKEFKKSSSNYFLVKGILKNATNSEVNEVNYLSSSEMNELMASSQLIICRSGYSSIMDVCKLKKKAIFIPTPGQTEQEYLAEELEKRGIAFYQPQNLFCLKDAIEKSKEYSGFAGFEQNPNLLRNAIFALLKSNS